MTTKRKNDGATVPHNINITGGNNIKQQNVANFVYGGMGNTINNNYCSNSKLDNLVNEAWGLIKAGSKKHVSTRAERSAYKVLKQYRSVFIKGKQGSGKTTLGRNILARVLKQTHRLPIMLSSWNEWNLIPKVNHENLDRDKRAEQRRYVVLIDDMFRSSNQVESNVISWGTLLDRIWTNVESGHLWLIITSRPEIGSQCDEQIRKSKLMKTIRFIVLDEEEYVLTRGEKLKMVKKICADKFFTLYECEQIVGMPSFIGFLQCCTFFASSRKAQAKGVKFFEKPREFVLKEIDRIHENDCMGYLVLLLILMKDGCLSSDQLTLSTYTNQLKPLAEVLKECCCNRFDFTAAGIKSKIENFLGVYLIDTGEGYKFQHQYIYDCVFIHISRKDPTIAIGHCPPKMLVELMHTKKTNENETVVILPRGSFHVLADRIRDLLLSESYSVILDHPSLRDKEFVTFLTERWRDKNSLTEVIQKKHDMKDVTVSVPSIKSITLLQYTSLISDVILQGLMLLRDDILSDVFHKVDTTELLAPALYIQDNRLVQKLLDKCTTPPSDYFLALCVSPAIDKGIKERLTENITEIPQPRVALLVSVLAGHKFLVEYILHHLKGDKNIVEWCQTILKLSLLPRGREWSSSLQTTCQDPITMCEILHMLIALIHANCPLQVIANEDGNTLLHLAVETGNIHCTKMFLDEQHVPYVRLHPNCLQLGNTDRRTPLHLAAMSGSSETVELLLEKGADVSTQDKDGDTPLHLAVKSGNSETAELLLKKGADVSKQNNDGVTSLLLANNKILQLLLRYVESGSSETRELLQDKRTVVSAQNMDGNTSLHLAAKRGSSEIVKLLLEKGADVSPQDIDGDTPLHLAVESGSSETVKLLLDKGADVSAQSYYGNTPLHLAAMSGSSETVKILLDKGADVSIKDEDRNTPLHLAAKSGSSETVKLLLEKVADVSPQDIDGATPLHLAVESGSSETVELLLDKGADVSAKSYYGNTPLHLAAWSGSSETVKILLDKGADVSPQDKDGDTPLHLAAKRRRSEIVKLLQEKGADVSAQDI